MKRRLSLLALMLALAGCGGSSGTPDEADVGMGPDASRYARTIVSIAFDDGRDSQWTTRDLFTSNGIRATFFIISSKIGAPGYMTAEQIQALSADGHEIGGHTVTHPANLALLAPADQVHEVCDGKTAVEALGVPTLRSFAYPRDSSSPELEKVIEGCGFTSARLSSGIVNFRGCSACPDSERLPPVNPYELRAFPSIDATATLESLQQVVDAAAGDGGGWVILVFHKVCDPLCDTLAITPTLLGDFTSWLVQNGIETRTIGDIMNGVR